MPLPALIPVVGAIISAVGWVDLGVWAVTDKDIIEHVTGVDVVGGFLDWVWPGGGGSADGTATATTQATATEGLMADPLFFMAITVVAVGVLGLLLSRRRRRYYQGGY